MALLCAVLPTYICWGAPHLNVVAHPATASAEPAQAASTTSAASSPSAPVSAVFPADGKVFLGVSVSEIPKDLAEVDTFAVATRYTPRSVLFTRAWERDGFDPEPFNKVAARGALPMLSWEPWDPRLQTGKAARDAGFQPAYRLSRIIGGDFDPYIGSYARGIKALGYRVAIRFGHEMNGFWYPWAEQTNGNRPGDYAKAFRHVHDQFTALGVTNVTWVWSPNVTYAGGPALAPLYPGDSYVDWLGLSGYYGIGGPAYLSFDTVFGASMLALRQLARKPIVITEIAATDEIGRKADWVSDMFRSLPRNPDIIGLIWFEVAKETDWRIASSPKAAAAFAAGAADPRYDARWTLTSVARTNAPAAAPSPSGSVASRRS